MIKVLGDQYVWDFGGPAVGAVQSLATAGTSICHVYTPHAPVVLSVGQSWMFQINAASQTVGATFEFELRWWER